MEQPFKAVMRVPPDRWSMPGRSTVTAAYGRSPAPCSC